MNRILFSLLAVLSLFSATATLAQPAPPAPPSGRLLDAWPFSGTNYLSTRRFAPLSLTNVALVPAWAGNGLQVDSTNAAWINYAVVETNGHTNLDCSQGTVEMWFSPDWNSADGLGAWGTLLEVGTWNTNLATGAWGLYLSPDASNLYFSAQSNGFSTNYLSASIAWNAGDWHHLAITYCATNSALYLEGELVTTGPGVSVIPSATVLNSGFSLGSDGNGTGLLQARGIFNNLITYNYQLTADIISQNYSDDSLNVYPLPSDPLSGGGFHTFTMDSSDLPSPPGASGGSGGSSPSFNSPQYGSNDFWLEALSPGTNAYNSNPSNLTLILHGTQADIEYQILSTTNVQRSNTVWATEQEVIGSEVTNFTSAIVPRGTNGQMFFKALAVSLDTTGNGIPDWWQQKYFGYVGVDPYANPMGDGYRNLYKYQHGMNPNIYYPPASPVVSAILNTNGNAVVSWPAAANLPSYGAGAVTGYTLQFVKPYLDYNYNPDLVTNTVTLGSNQMSYTNQLNSDYMLSFDIQFPTVGPTPTCALQVNYANGSSQWSQLVPSFDPTCTVNAAVVRGPQGALYLSVSALPPNVGAIRIGSTSGGLYYPINSYGSPGSTSFGDDQYFAANIVSDGTNWITAYFDVPVSSISNGLYQIPPSQAPFFTVFSLQAMGIGTNGNLGTPFQVSPPYDWGNWYVTFWYGSLNFNAPFMDGRTNIAQNINLLLRGADWQNPFSLSLFQPDGYNDGGYTFDAGLSQPTNYVWDGFSQVSGGGEWTWTPIYQRNEFQPFEETSLFTNVIFNLDLFDSAGNFTNALTVNENNSGELDLMDPTKMFDGFAYATNNQSLPLSPLQAPVLTQDAQSWIACEQGVYEVFSPFQYYSGSLLWNGGNSWTLPIGTKNIYGLAILSIKYFGTNNSWDTVGQGTPFSMANLNFFQYVSPPVLNTAGYYFARPQIDPTPGLDNFTVTNITPPYFIIPFGQQFYLTAWAKQSVLNGYSGVYAYPQQYFDKAFMSDGAGNITTNQTGLLSEYGDFFPLHPGKVFLTTKADASTGTTNACPVYVIKLQLDVNHDSVMDTSYAGPDNTTADRPYIFWINNDRDYSSKPADPGKDIMPDPNYPDFSFFNIPSQRDLEDWARLWIVGLPPLTTNYQATLSWNVISGNPAINLVRAVETNGGTLYLKDTNIASQQAGGTGQYIPSYKIATVTATQPWSIWAGYLTNGLTNCFLFEGAGIGKGELVLTISQNGSNILSTSTFLDIHDVKDLYERAFTTNYDLNPPSSKVSSFVITHSPPANPTQDTNVIVFVHGLNTSDFDYYNTSETMFKRLYWQGFQGRFAAYRWPSPLFKLLPTGANDISYLGFNQGEFISFHSGTGLKGYLDTLTNRFPGYSINVAVHSLGNAAANEAIREGAHVDNYALMQAAISAKALDGANTNLNYAFLVNQENQKGTPDANVLGGYNNCFTNTTRRVNFYNDDDWALARGPGQMWEGNQHDFKPDSSLTFPGYYYQFDGTNSSLWLTSESGVTLARVLTDDFEKKAYVARSRSKAVGAAGLKYTPFALPSGAVNLNVSLQDATKGFTGGAQFGDTRPEHSGEFTKPIQNAAAFYKRLLNDGFLIAPNP